MNTVADNTSQASAVPASPAPITLRDILELMRHHYREELAQGTKACLGVIASLSLKNRDHCLVLILEGGSGRGKSLIIRVLNPDRASTQAVLERVDDFTPASFVSHAANRNKKQLAEIDMLPRIRGKVMLTKKLAPLFGDEEKELRQNVSRLTAVLDGEGYKTHSGTHGRRGYEGRYVFNWIGATTPIPTRTYRVMSQLGNRILSYEVAGEEATEAELVEFAQTYETNDTVKECRVKVNEFLEQHFKLYPVESVDPHDLEIPTNIQEAVVRYAKLIAKGRVTVSEGCAELPEDPRRVILLLQTLLRGLALADDRLKVIAEDLDIIRHVAFSSIPSKRRDLLRAILASGGEMDAGQVDEALNITRPTSLGRMRDLGYTGICEFQDGEPNDSRPARLCLCDEFKWWLPPLNIPWVRGMPERNRCKR